MPRRWARLSHGALRQPCKLRQVRASLAWRGERGEPPSQSVLKAGFAPGAPAQGRREFGLRRNLRKEKKRITEVVLDLMFKEVRDVKEAMVLAKTLFESHDRIPRAVDVITRELQVVSKKQLAVSSQ